MAVSLTAWTKTDATTLASFLSAIIDHIAHPMFVKDREHRFVLVNRALSQMMGHPVEEILGKTDHDFFPAAEADFFRAKDQEVFRTGQEAIIEEEPLTDRLGTHHILATIKVPLRDSQGKVTHVVGIFSDITRLKAAEEALRLSNEQLDRRVQQRTAELALAQAELVRKERLAVLGRLAGGLAHQIRNPLGAIVNATSLLERAIDRARATPEVLDAIAVLHEESWRANRIITDLIDFARVRPPARTRADIRELLEHAVHMQSPPADVRVEWQLETGSLHAAIDVEQVLGALGNVIRNALEAMLVGGTLTLSARQDGAFVCILVRDTGKGVSEEIKERLFHPLVTSKAFGLGLGLSTARALIENQGGRVELVRSDERGSEFAITLPAGTSSSEAP